MTETQLGKRDGSQYLQLQNGQLLTSRLRFCHQSIADTIHFSSGLVLLEEQMLLWRQPIHQLSRKHVRPNGSSLSEVLHVKSSHEASRMTPRTSTSAW